MDQENGQMESLALCVAGCKIRKSTQNIRIHPLRSMNTHFKIHVSLAGSSARIGEQMDGQTWPQEKTLMVHFTAALLQMASILHKTQFLLGVH